MPDFRIATVTDSQFFLDILPNIGISCSKPASDRPPPGFSHCIGRFSGGFLAFEEDFGTLIARYGKISIIFSEFITVCQ